MITTNGVGHDDAAREGGDAEAVRPLDRKQLAVERDVAHRLLRITLAMVAQSQRHHAGWQACLDPYLLVSRGMQRHEVGAFGLIEDCHRTSIGKQRFFKGRSVFP